MSITPYVAGELVGRLAFSWLLVACVYLLVYRLRWKMALKRSFWPWGWFWALLVFVLGIVGNGL